MRLTVLMLIASAALAADVCPHAASTAEWHSWSAKIGSRHCVANGVNAGSAVVTWPAAGIVQANVVGSLEFAVCCFPAEMEKPAPLRLGARELTVSTHQESHDAAGDEDDFPDLIEDDAHTKSISIRGTFGEAAHPVRVDVLLRCSASKFADQFAFQFVIVNRSADPVEIVWDHLRNIEHRLAPSIQPVAGGKAWVFLTPTKPTESPATVELKTPAGVVLGRFQFDGFTLSS